MAPGRTGNSKASGGNATLRSNSLNVVVLTNLMPLLSSVDSTASRKINGRAGIDAQSMDSVHRSAFPHRADQHAEPISIRE